mmetsp:Transcript_7733/g.19914  ORF Transcript_7733/g.19914 Transcript_7733/m.19914 type:complete len:203 (+) Transcript_7733:879-1487(+)
MSSSLATARTCGSSELSRELLATADSRRLIASRVSATSVDLARMRSLISERCIFAIGPTSRTHDCRATCCMRLKEACELTIETEALEMMEPSVRWLSFRSFSRERREVCETDACDAFEPYERSIGSFVGGVTGPTEGTRPLRTWPPPRWAVREQAARRAGKCLTARNSRRYGSPSLCAWRTGGTRYSPRYDMARWWRRLSSC